MATHDTRLGTQRGHSFSDFSERFVDNRVHLEQKAIAPIQAIMQNMSPIGGGNSKQTLDRDWET